MITDKDREIVNEIHNACEWGAFELADKKLQKYADSIRAESADQARKEAAEIVYALSGMEKFRNPAYNEGYERGLYEAHHAILNSTVNEGKTEA